jgi:hypothetical protein
VELDQPFLYLPRNTPVFVILKYLAQIYQNTQQSDTETNKSTMNGHQIIDLDAAERSEKEEDARDKSEDGNGSDQQSKGKESQQITEDNFDLYLVFDLNNIDTTTIKVPKLVTVGQLELKVRGQLKCKKLRIRS